eukprot:TRINITY_DN16584_c0_g1_i1.p1 TRINITY_DN16584_c0_g1~~TRINITY_DN16584_c0_g1_i1.p1  ORF type:complete len:348 (-),score=68.08 TRINITY_DN16584_c0_g1_i1:198-1241(-)
MSSLRARLGRELNVRVTTDKKNVGHEHRIQSVSEGEVARRYKLGGMVMESTNKGMEVVWATRLADQRQCVVKVRKKNESFKSASDERTWRSTTEVQLSMPPIETMCEFMEVLETPERYLVVMEKVDGKDLYEQMEEKNISHIDAREIVRQTLVALAAMHASGRIHKDLKAENVMVDIPAAGSAKAKEIARQKSMRGGDAASPATVKLIDFDTVEDWEPMSPKAKDVLGTDGYIAPEAYLGNYSPASDIYSVGVVMYKLLTGEFPSNEEIFDDQPGENWVGSPAMQRVHDKLKTEKMDFTKSPLDSCTQAADLCARMLSFNFNDRPSADDALKHDWFLLDSAKLPNKR